MYSLADAASVNDLYRAVGMLCRSMKSFDQLLSDSILAPALEGPKQSIPIVDKTSAMPPARGSSGPTMTSDTSLSVHHRPIAWLD